MTAVDPSAVRELRERTRASSGVPATTTDPTALARLSTLLTTPPHNEKTTGPRPVAPHQQTHPDVRSREPEEKVDEHPTAA